MFEIRDATGNTDMLIRHTYLGKAPAQSLGSSNCISMRGPGSTTTGPSIDVAVYRAIYAEVNTKLQMQATALGPIKFLTQDFDARRSCSGRGHNSRAGTACLGLAACNSASGSAVQSGVLSDSAVF